jgi:hypothetical protein
MNTNRHTYHSPQESAAPELRLLPILLVPKQLGSKFISRSAEGLKISARLIDAVEGFHRELGKAHGCALAIPA